MNKFDGKNKIILPPISPQRNTTDDYTVSKKLELKTCLSPSLKKKMELDNIEKRAQRNTPELPTLANLQMKYCDCEEESSCDSNDIERKIVPQDESDLQSQRMKHENNQHSKDFAASVISRVPSHRRLRVRTLENDHYFDIASTERMKRNTDSMIEDVVIANKLKRRLGARREQITGRTITDTSLSDFLMKSILEGSLDAVAAARPTNESLHNAAKMASKVCLEGYFESLDDVNIKQKAKNIFLESLIREEFYENNVICRQNDEGDKLFVIEEGSVQFTIGDHVVGTAHTGSIFGELSLIYGIPRAADVKVVTPCAILWSMDSLAFRRVQALIANQSLKATTKVFNKRDQLKLFRKQHSSLTDLQEQTGKLQSTKINLKQIKRLSIIGKGTFGSVYLVSVHISSDTKRDKYYALKSMSKTSIEERSNEKRVIIERNILQELSSPFIISLMSTLQDKNSIYFLTDFVQGGNLMSYMIKKDILSHSECVFFAANIVSALLHVHKKGFIHRDVKPENCLIDKNGYLKLCDFGMAKRLPCIVQLPKGGTEIATLAFTMCGTPDFMAPEFVLSTGYDKGVDWWALGCIVFEMYAGRSPFDFDGNLKKTFKEVCMIGMERKQLVLPKQLHINGLDAAKNFIRSLLTTMIKRLGHDDNNSLKRHEYFDSINFDQLSKKQISAPYKPNISHASDTSHFTKDTANLSDSEVPVYSGDNDWCKNF